MDNYSSSDYSSSVRDFLLDDWKDNEPLPINPRDWDIGTQLLTNLALKTSRDLNTSRFNNSSSLSEERVKVYDEVLSEQADRVRDFVQKHSVRFREICKTGIPFSMLERSTCESALEYSLEHYDSIITRLMTQKESEWLTEEELNQCFGEAFKHLDIKAIKHACSALAQNYKYNSDYKAGYYLLWLIKQSCGCDFNFPQKNTFDDSTVSEVLSNFFVDGGRVEYINNFIDILVCREHRLLKPFYQLFLNSEKSVGSFSVVTLELLKSVLMNEWPRKGVVITELLETQTPEIRMFIAKHLASSLDGPTALVGENLLGALQAASLKSAIPHFYELVKLLPHINRHSFQLIFGKPFVPFREDPSYYKFDPEFTRRLSFNSRRGVFVSGNLMIGEYFTGTLGVEIPPYLLAFNMETEKMEWGIPLPLRENGMHPYRLDRVDHYITIEYMGEGKVDFIDLNTGDLTSTIRLPYVNTDHDELRWDRLHWTPDAFGYQMVNLGNNRKLIGGRIADSKLNPLFDVETPCGAFLPLSTHVGFLSDFKEKLVIFSQRGDHVTLDCLSAYAKGNKLYLIEPNPPQENTCWLTVRTLTNDEKVVSDVEKRILLDTRKASVEKLCDNGQLIIRGSSFIFVDMNTDEVVYSRARGGTCTLITESGEIWSWGDYSNKIWKSSSANNTLMGSLPGGHIDLVHVDQDDHLYIVTPKN